MTKSKKPFLRLITVSGQQAAGKNTLATIVAKRLCERGEPAVPYLQNLIEANREISRRQHNHIEAAAVPDEVKAEDRAIMKDSRPAFLDTLRAAACYYLSLGQSVILPANFRVTDGSFFKALPATVAWYAEKPVHVFYVHIASHPDFSEKRIQARNSPVEAREILSNPAELEKFRITARSYRWHGPAYLSNPARPEIVLDPWGLPPPFPKFPGQLADELLMRLDYSNAPGIIVQPQKSPRPPEFEFRDYLGKAFPAAIFGSGRR